MCSVQPVVSYFSAFLASLWTANWFGWCVPVSPTVVADADAAELLPCFWLGPGPDDDAEAALDDWDDSDLAALVEGLQKLDIVMFVRCVCRKLWSWCWCFCPLAWLVKAASPILEMSNCDWHTRHFACLTSFPCSSHSLYLSLPSHWELKFARPRHYHIKIEAFVVQISFVSEVKICYCKSRRRQSSTITQYSEKTFADNRRSFLYTKLHMELQAVGHHGKQGRRTPPNHSPFAVC